jgi:predicted transcriptional regulator
MNFSQAALLGSYISKDYAEDLFRLLATYKNISASEAASRLNMHIKTVQDFLEAMASLDILDKTEATEKKRPYFRYALKTRRIRMEVDLTPLFEKTLPDSKLIYRIRESKETRARFTISRNNQYISNVYIWIGTGRDRKERKLNLSIPQGRFLYHLPFPSAEPLSIMTIMENAGVDGSNVSEILDIVDVLLEYRVIEKET